MRYVGRSAPNAYLVSKGVRECTDGHIGTQVLTWESPHGSHTLWTCPRCHRMVRQDLSNAWLRRKPAWWTTPEVQVPRDDEGATEGVAVPGGRAWKMPARVDEPTPWYRRFIV